MCLIRAPLQVGAFEKACRCTVPVHNGTRRPGDLASLHANVELAATELGWRATRSVEEMCVKLGIDIHH